MNTCKNLPKPAMWIPKEYTKKRKDWFLNHKYKPLCTYLNKNETQSMLYKGNRFADMANKILTIETNGLRIYFAAYPDVPSQDFPRGFESVITFIFSPIIAVPGNTRADRGDFYILNPDSDYIEITYKAQDWINNFQQKQLLHVLNKLSPFPKGDTSSVLYEKKSILGLISEMNCQKATGLRIHLSSYTDTDDGTPAPHNIKIELLKRLMVQFSLTQDPDYTDFEIEDTDGWGQRPGPPIELLDNGQLCPPTNCPKP